MSETGLYSAWPHITYQFLMPKGRDETLCLSVCLFYVFAASVGGCRHRRAALHRWQSPLCVYTLFHMWRYIPRRCMKTYSLPAVCCFFLSSHTHTHTCIHTGCIFSWLEAGDCEPKEEAEWKALSFM